MLFRSSRIAASEVGAEAAGAWVQWRKLNSHPSFRDCLKNPAKSTGIPTTVVMTWVPEFAEAIGTDVPKAWELLRRIPADIANQVVFTAVQKYRNAMQTSPDFAAWVAETKRKVQK